MKRRNTRFVPTSWNDISSSYHRITFKTNEEYIVQHNTYRTPLESIGNTKHPRLSRGNGSANPGAYIRDKHSIGAQDQPPEGPLLSTPMVFKKGSIILRFRSSCARRSLSFAGTGTLAEIRTVENIPARAVSTACRRMARGLAVGSGTFEVKVRVRRRILPAAATAAAAAVAVGEVGCLLGLTCSSDGFSEDCRGGIDVTGATSLAMRASMKVTKVKETLCAGEYARLSRTQAWDSSQDKGGALVFSRARICWSRSDQTGAVTIPSFKDLRNTSKVSLKISKR